MKPCAKNRKRIALLAMPHDNAVYLDVDTEVCRSVGDFRSLNTASQDVPEAEIRDLAEHLKTCESCRHYYNEILNLTETLTSKLLPSNLRASENFHQRVVEAVGGTAPAQVQSPKVGSPSARRALGNLSSILHAYFGFLSAGFGFPILRGALPVIGAIGVIIIALSTFTRHPAIPLPTATSASTTSGLSARADLTPTVANYQAVANRSLDRLDDLLTEQGKRHSGSTTIYTASLHITAASISDWSSVSP
jgi:hypothetical protein